MTFLHCLICGYDSPEIKPDDITHSVICPRCGDVMMWDIKNGPNSIITYGPVPHNFTVERVRWPGQIDISEQAHCVIELALRGETMSACIPDPNQKARPPIYEF